MNTLKMHSPNLTQQNIEKLFAPFPNCVTESQDAKGQLHKSIEFELLKQELSERIVDGNALAACFAKDGEITEDFVKALTQREPLRVVFRDAGFAGDVGDAVKINVTQIFKLMSPHTKVKTL